MAWVYLTIAGLFEIGWAIGLKYSDGFSKALPSLLTLLAMGISIWMLALAMRTI
ncbi:MAG: QacE family quaternary ammonium compound efflux SMR transporter, partial [Xanthomonadales bacterium]|nr:QacE family quaternary ammonium compound efflux SMR transporter [Gammaproteobacteria bacterium]NNK05183.1 QacE family quaternary ammonium compound efflux SMR transporter [Xanthomonadales bacterium]